jgi:hypothetical protein
MNLIVTPAGRSRPQVNAGVSGRKVTARLHEVPAFAGTTE